jgi:hypothetical protein
MGIISKYLSIILSGDRGINGTRKGQAIQCNLWSKENRQVHDFDTFRCVKNAQKPKIFNNIILQQCQIV